MKILLPIFIILAIWDMFTTVFGTIGILGGATIGSVITGIAVAIITIVMFFMTFEIWSDTHNDTFAGTIMKTLWLTAGAYDLFTSFYGNREFIAGEVENPASIAVIILATVLVSGSTIIASWIINNE